jgi:hypothetical protein
MDPLTALSVAGNAVQFVDFGSKILFKSYKLYKSQDGVLMENLGTEQLLKRCLSIIIRSKHDIIYYYLDIILYQVVRRGFGLHGKRLLVPTENAQREICPAS